LIVAKKLQRNESPGDCIFVNLWEKPRNSIDALALASLIEKATPAVLEGQTVCEIVTDGRKYGEDIATENRDLRSRRWTFEIAFAQTDLCRVAYYLSSGKLYVPGRGTVKRFPVTTLLQLGATLGPDRRDIMDGFNPTSSPTAYLGFQGHESNEIRTMAQRPNGYYSPLSRALPDRHLRNPHLLWSRAGRLMLAERLRLNTHRLAAVLLEKPVLSNVWYSTQLNRPGRLSTSRREKELKALVLWLNSTLGLITLIAARVETEGAWVEYKKPALGPLTILDVGTLSPNQLDSLAGGYQKVSSRELQPFPNIAADSTRAEIDHIVANSLGMPDASIFRELLAEEPLLSPHKKDDSPSEL
jgi:hypothetical protein